MLDTRYIEGAASSPSPGTNSWSSSLASAGLLTCLRIMLPMPGVTNHLSHHLLVWSRALSRVTSEGTHLPSSSSIPSDSQLNFHITFNFPSLTRVTYLERWQASMSVCYKVTRPGGCCHSVTVCHLPPHTLPELPAVQNWTVLTVQEVQDKAFFKLVLQWIG